MKKIIGGKLYDTETAAEVGSWWNGRSRNDFDHCYETLFRNSKGAYFLHGQGGARSVYAQSAGDMLCGGEAIQPMSEDDAKLWAEQHLDASEYIAEWGAPSEAEGR